MFKLSFVCNLTGTAKKGVAYHPDATSLLALAHDLQLGSPHYESMVIAIEENHTPQHLADHGLEYCTTVGTAFYTCYHSSPSYGNKEYIQLLLA